MPVDVLEVADNTGPRFEGWGKARHDLDVIGVVAQRPTALSDVGDAARCEPSPSSLRTVAPGNHSHRVNAPSGEHSLAAEHGLDMRGEALGLGDGATRLPENADSRERE